ncbi:unnamed protein product [Ectocarpus sp. 13 AM-2016]
MNQTANDGRSATPAPTVDVDEMELDKVSGSLDFSFLRPLCVATRSFNSRQDVALGLPTANNFLKGASFSPDGTCLLTSSDDTVLRVFEVPGHALLGEKRQATSDTVDDAASSAHSDFTDDWSPCLYSVEGETVYDFAWYPHMSSSEPATSVFVSTSRDHPLHMWDAFTGNLRATYRAYDHLDEVVAANSVCFNTAGNKIFAGYNRMIRIFDVSQPGRSFEARPTCKTRKSKTGQRGIISALSFCPENSGGGLFAAGSYAKTICLYSENSRARAVAELATPTMGGVTHLKFAPNGRYLFSGSRKDTAIVCWDLRHTKQAIYTLPRQVDTNQRIGFDVDPSGRYLATGSTERRALVYDTESQSLVGLLENQTDAVGSICFHPHAPVLAVCTGQRHFELDTDSDSDSGVSIEGERQRGDMLGGTPSTEWKNGVTLHGVGTPCPDT